MRHQINSTDRYKMANIQCGGSPTVVYGENAMALTNRDRMAYMIGVTVNVTTTNDDGTVTYQVLAITNATFKAVGDVQPTYLCVYMRVSELIDRCVCLNVCMRLSPTFVCVSGHACTCTCTFLFVCFL